MPRSLPRPATQTRRMISLDLAVNADRRRPVARRLLCRGHGRGDDLLRHARHRQHRPPGLHHARVLRRLHRQFQLWHRPDSDRRGHGAGVFSRRHGGLPDLLLRLRTARRGVDPGSRLLLRSVVCRRGRADPGVRRRLPVCRSPLHRSEPASRLCRPAVAHAGPVPGLAVDARGAASLLGAHLYRPRHPGRVAGPAGPAADGGQPQPRQAHRLRHLDRHRLGRRRAA